MSKSVFFLLLRKRRKFLPLREVPAFQKLQGKPKINHSTPLPPVKKKIKPIPTLINPTKSKSERTLSSTSFEIFRTKEATISPTPKLLKPSGQYLSMKRILKGGE